jgi:cyclopropane fatty-acyl-phospholipid synthase-like methyltransferase
MTGPADLLHELSAKAANGARIAALRLSRKVAGAKNFQRSPGFFDQYPKFFETSSTTAFEHRLNQRYRACIEANADIIKGKRILDIASHDGRWSFAALKAGAAHVTGLEARTDLVKSGIATMREYGVPENSFASIAGDAFATIDQIEPRSVDTVFCFGFFYHVANHMLLLSKIARLQPRNVIIYTAVTPDPRPVVLFQKEDPDLQSDAARTAQIQKLVLAGIPSKAAMDLMVVSFGWAFKYYDWRKAGITH